MNGTNQINIEILNSCKAYRKADRCTQDSINKSLKMLKTRIESYARNNVGFNQIFNDDNVKYDVYRNDKCSLYALKSRDNKLQLRLLYTVKIEEQGMSIILVDFETKKSNDKKYITRFAEFTKKFTFDALEFNAVAI